MNSPTREAAVEVCGRISVLLHEWLNEWEGDPEREKCNPAAALLGVLLVLCNFVMHDDNWHNRTALFDAIRGCKWPDSATVRTRVEELLDGVNLRSDYWNLN